MSTPRPNPDALLESVQREEEEQRRGKLKIFFGASAGVGKTYAMLSAARDAFAQGVKVIVGVVETHGRKETAALLRDLETLPPQEIIRDGNPLKEFDLDAALERGPELLLVDELAHSNIPGSRHPKRWQDIEELLQAGVNVYTTLNVQHLESLNDVVGGITGIRVWETVPDRVFDRADEVVLVDLPPDELIRRLNEGKVYHLPQAEQALKNFFNKGNLVALRELSLRRTADRVDADLKTFRASRSIQKIWPTHEALVVGIGRSQENAVRAAARLAERMEMPWHAVHVETSEESSEAELQGIQDALKLAEGLGAQTAVIPGRDVPESLVEYARSRNIAKVLLARGFEEEGRLSWKHVLPPVLRASVSARIARLAPDLDVIRVAVAPRRERTGIETRRHVAAGRNFPKLWNYLFAALLCAGVAVVSALLRPVFEPTNIAMLFLLAVLLSALRLGRGPAVFSAFLGVAAFDYFFVPPHFTFAVSDFQYLLTFGVMLAVALITGYLTTDLRYQARAAARREGRFRALYEMARELSAALLRDQVVATGERFLRPGFQIRSRMLFPDAHRKILPSPDSPASDVAVDFAVAQWAFDHGQLAGLGTDTLPGSHALYIPLKAPMRMRGVLVVESENGTALDPEQMRHLEAAASLLAIAFERVHYVEVAQDALVRMESERLRNSLLAALSHDVRTPLTALVGLADALARSPDTLSPSQRELVTALHDEAERMNRLVHNLLDMAQLAAGKVRLHPEWQSLEESVGGALRASGSALKKHSIVTDLPRDLPLVRFDAVLIERVLCNLLENAAKYTPAGSVIRVSARARNQKLEVAVEDNGPGFPPGKEEGIFEKFTRGEEESAISGIGLGLSICRAIVEAHGGKIRAERPQAGGARFIFSLPLESPPQMTPENTEKPA